MSSAHVPEWRAVIDEWRRTSVDRLGGEVDIPQPASAIDVDQAEERLGVTLPEELAALYRSADGLPTLYGRFCGIRGCAELEWFRDAEAGLIEILDDINGGQNAEGSTGMLTPGLDLMRAGLAISKDGDGYRLFCVPTVDGSSWQLYSHTDDGGGVNAEPSLIGQLMSDLGMPAPLA